MVLLLACRDACSPEVTPPAASPARTVDPLGPVALFGRPFAGEHPVTNFFDHGAVARGRALMRNGGVTWGIEAHHAYDFPMPEGTPLLAMADGVVVKAGDLGPKRCMGGGTARTSVELRVLHEAPDGRQWVSIFEHLSRLHVAQGDRVTAGAIVALSGNTGCSTDPHLHLEVHRVTDPATRKGHPVDPYGWAADGPDPWAERTGVASVWLWRDGEAPRIARGARGADVGLVRMIATDPVDPVDGEWVEVRAPADLQGWTLSDAGGVVLPLPELRAGEVVRLATSSFGRTTELWDDLGDCAILRDPHGLVRSTLRYGRGDRCPDPTAPPPR